MNFYTKADPARALDTGLSELDTGLRLRYEISRKFAPYVGLAYTQQVGATAGLARKEGEIVHDARFVFGIRTWY
jgi:copper resistance protein B